MARDIGVCIMESDFSEKCLKSMRLLRKRLKGHASQISGMVRSEDSTTRGPSSHSGSCLRPWPSSWTPQPEFPRLKCRDSSSSFMVLTWGWNEVRNLPSEQRAWHMLGAWQMVAILIFLWVPVPVIRWGVTTPNIVVLTITILFRVIHPVGPKFGQGSAGALFSVASPGVILGTWLVETSHIAPLMCLTPWHVWL